MLCCTKVASRLIFSEGSSVPETSSRVLSRILGVISRRPLVRSPYQRPIWFHVPWLPSELPRLSQPGTCQNPANNRRSLPRNRNARGYSSWTSGAYNVPLRSPQRYSSPIAWCRRVGWTAHYPTCESLQTLLVRCLLGEGRKRRGA